MAAGEDKDSKSEAPTEKKISDTLEKGNTPFSREVGNASAILALVLIGYFYLPTMVGNSAAILGGMFANLSEWPLDNATDAAHLLNHTGRAMLLLLAPFAATLVIFGLAAALGQNRPRLVLTRIAPKFEKISPAKGMKRLIGREGFREFCKSMFKFTAAGVVALFVILSQSETVLSLIASDSLRLLGGLYTLFLQVALGVLATIAVLGAIDFIWVRKDWFDDLKMSKQEIKDELKQSEGDPIVKMRTRSVARDRARRRMMSQVAQASLVIANPTHFCVAMRYDPKIDKVPVVLAKGQDLIALKIREIAEQNAIPVFEDPPLARALHKVVRVDSELPVEFYVPVAKIIRIISDKEKAKLH